MIWDPKSECMEPGERDELKLKLLQQTAAKAFERVPFLRKKWESKGVGPGDLRKLDDLAAFPFMTKDDLRATYPYGLFAVPKDEIIRIHASSGTTGKPTIMGYTRADIEVWSEVIARTLTGAGVKRGDVLQNAYGYGLFTGGLGLHCGAEKLGATVIPISGGQTEKQIMLMEDLGTTVLCCTPSYALFIGEALHKNGADRSRLRLRVGLFGAEPWTAGIRREIEARLGLSAFDIYGLSEVIGPGVAFECEEKEGLHVNEDYFHPEIIDPDSGEPLPDGHEGELVFTCLAKDAMPIIRFRTRDISRIWREKCRCGRTLAKMERVRGRTDDMLIIRGVNVFPSQVESLLLDINEVEPHYLLVVKREGSLDSLDVLVEVKPWAREMGGKKIKSIEAEIAHRIKTFIGISANARVVDDNTIERSMGKAMRVKDQRKILTAP